MKKVLTLALIFVIGLVIFSGCDNMGNSMAEEIESSNDIYNKKKLLNPQNDYYYTNEPLETYLSLINTRLDDNNLYSKIVVKVDGKVVLDICDCGPWYEYKIRREDLKILPPTN